MAGQPTRAQRLSDACLMGKEGVVLKLLDSGEFQNLNKVSDGSKRYFLLHAASTHGHDTLVELLCRRGAKANQQDESGDTPLHLATFRGHCQVIRTLVELGADVDAADASGNTPLHIATAFTVLPPCIPGVPTGDNYPALCLLLKLGAKLKTNAAGQNPLDNAFSNDGEKVMKKLLKSRSFSDVEGNAGTLQRVLRHEDPTAAVRMAQWLLVATHSTRRRFKLLAQVLVDAHGAGRSMDVLFTTIDQLIRARGSQSLLPGGVGAILTRAVALQNEDVVRMLIHRGTSVNAASPDIFPLKTACAGESVGIVDLLLESGARVNDRAGKGTPLHFAILCERTEYVLKFLENNADVNLQSEDTGVTPLHIAYQIDRRDFVDKLLSYHADPTLRDNEGRMPADCGRRL